MLSDPIINDALSQEIAALAFEIMPRTTRTLGCTRENMRLRGGHQKVS
jgi:hypothetical protein